METVCFTQLGVFLSSVGVYPDKSSPTPGSSLSSDVKQSCHSQLTNPLLVFVKAYRLRGDVSGLRDALLPVVDSLFLLDAHKAHWQHDLEDLGLTFGDIIVAFDTLGNAIKLPAIYVEATDLISIGRPPVALDPVAKKYLCLQLIYLQVCDGYVC